MDNLKKIRLEQGLSFNDLAKKTGISAGYLCHLEKWSRTNPGKIKMETIAKALNKTVEEVFFGK